MKTALYENPLDGQWQWFPVSDELVVDERWGRILGLDCGPDCRLSRAGWLSRMHPEDEAALAQSLNEVADQRRENVEFELRCRHGDGHWIWLLLNARTAVDGADGNVVVNGVVQDITSRKQKEAMLREEHFFLGRTEQVTGVGTWQIDLVNQRVAWSEETCRIHGRRPGFRLTFDEAVNYFSPSAQQAFRACVDQAVDSGETLDIELPLNRADGKRIMVRWIGAVEYHDSKAFRLSGAVQDVTERTSRLLDEASDSNFELERANERLSLATSSGGIGIWDLDVHTGKIVWDAQMFALYDLEALPGEPIDAERWLSFLHEEDRPLLRNSWRDEDCGHDANEIYFRIFTSDGTTREICATVRVIRHADGRILRMVGTNQDVTEARHLAREIARQHEILQVTLNSIGDGVITTDMTSHVLWMNPVAEAMVGWTSEHARGRPLSEVFNIVDGDTQQVVPDPVRLCLDENRIVGPDGHSLLISRGAGECWIEDSVAPIRNSEGDLYGAILVFRDVTQQRFIESEMTWRATHDALTGLVNRGEFESILNRLHAGAVKTGSTHALLFIDLDQFKIVNDSCGHSAGDQLLKEVSRMLVHCVRADDIVARLGGDEFAVILEQCDTDRAQLMARQICKLMDEYRYTHEGQRYRIGASIGLVSVGSDWLDISAIIRAADTACYAAKEAGRNRVHVWCENDSSVLLRRVQTSWATRLESALDDDGFELYAQRIDAIDSLPTARRSGSVTHSTREQPARANAEILLRLKSEGELPILPGAFMPAAERFNLVNRIDQWVMERVIGWLQKRADFREIGTLWVNLSGQSFSDLRFQQDTLERLKSAGRELCESLCFEITETAAVRNLADAAGFISDLRDLGIRIALDDFGAGASSFGYLKSLPVDYLKIDGQFVRDLQEDRLDAAAVRCFAEVARIMGIQTVAEFVETPEVLDRLQEIGVDFAQGWLLHRPVPIAELFATTELKHKPGVKAPANECLRERTVSVALE